VTDGLLTRTQAGDGDAFARLVEPFRRTLSQPHSALAGRLALSRRAPNGQPAFGLHARDPQTGDFHTVGLMVLTLSVTQISAMTRFNAGILPRFGLPGIFRPEPITRL
jgi:hypothetical protein